MTMPCDYADQRETMLMEYLYDEMDAAARSAFTYHLARCAACRADLDELRQVRSSLAAWTPPERTPGFVARAVLGESGSPPAPSARGRWWREIPAWAQVAAALLVVGVAAGIANFDVRYNRDGLTIRTGWSKTSAPLASSSTAAADRAADTRATSIAPASTARSTSPTLAPWQGDLAALGQQLRTEFRGQPMSRAASGVGVAPAAGGDEVLLRRVRALIDESERRQKRELALRVGELVNDVNTQRQADLTRIGNNLGVILNNTGLEALRQRQVQNELMGYIQRVSQQK